MGYSQEEIQESLSKMKYDEIIATYLLLGRKSSELDASDSSSSAIFHSLRSRVRIVTMLDQLFLQLWHIPKRVRPALQTVTLKKTEFPPGNQVALLVEERESLQPVPCLGMQAIPIRRIFLSARKAPLERTTADRHSVIQNGKENSIVPDQRALQLLQHTVSAVQPPQTKSASPEALPVTAHSTASPGSSELPPTMARQPHLACPMKPHHCHRLEAKTPLIFLVN
ncbi:hypothetical protein MC885_013370 [Smutsia gigantea]|nr:hypothetical protein MC885_013370 [Smutsia gigantea]